MGGVNILQRRGRAIHHHSHPGVNSQIRGIFQRLCRVRGTLPCNEHFGVIQVKRLNNQTGVSIGRISPCIVFVFIADRVAILIDQRARIKYNAIVSPAGKKPIVSVSLDSSY
jgi:hypothetical protein